MKQYRITSDAFHIPGSNPNVPDAYIDPATLNQLKAEAGIATILLQAGTVSKSITIKANSDKLKSDDISIVLVK